MDLTQFRTTYNVDDLRWAASREGFDTARSVTLTTSAFTPNADGLIPSGTPLTVDGTTGRYKLWATGLTVAGYLAAPIRVSAPLGSVAVGTAQPNKVGAMIDRGRINVAHVPGSSTGTPFPDAAGQASNARFTYVNDATV